MRPRPIALLVPALLACGAEPVAPAPAALPRHPTPVCARDDEAVLPDAAGRLRCVRVGADTARTAQDLPDPRAADPALPEPVRWVRAGASGGDGSRERPFATLAQAAEALPPAGGTVAVAAGRHPLPAAIAARGAVAVVGAGATHTVIVPARGGAVIAAGSGARVTLRGLSIEHDVADDVAGAAGDVSASGGAAVTLRDVVFVRPQTAVLATGAGTRVAADGLTVRGARGPAVALYDEARGVLRGVLVRDGRAIGVLATARVAGDAGARLMLTDALVAANLGGGVAVTGRAVAGTGATCEDADLNASVGDDDCLLRVSARANSSFGITAADGRIRVDVRRSYVGATRVGAAGAGDGVVVARGAHLKLDDDLRLAMTMADALGLGTQLLENARAGLLADGAETALRLHGALVASNAGPGVVLQRGAGSPAINYAVFSDNAGAGLAVTTGGGVDAILCDQFVFTRAATVRTAAGTVTVGDGLSAYGARVDALRDNVFSDNARFGLVLSGTLPRTLPAIQLDRNRGAGNAFGAGIYGDPPLVFNGPERIAGRAPAPAADPGGASLAL